MTTETKLWAVHIEGPDDYIACESEREAEKMCEGFNSEIAEHDATIAKAKVGTWPFDAESHAKEIATRKAYASIPQITKDEDAAYSSW